MPTWPAGRTSSVRRRLDRRQRTLRGYPVVAALYPFRGVNGLLDRPYRVGHSAQDPLCSPPATLFGSPTHGALRFSPAAIFFASLSAGSGGFPQTQSTPQTAARAYAAPRPQSDLGA